jgi:hypothetical protein
VLRFRAVIDPGLPIGTTVTNTAVVAWDTPTQTASASVSIDVGGTPGVGVLNGTAWHDADFDRLQGGAERALEGWTVELYRNGQRVHSTLTAADGSYRIVGLAPNDASSDRYELRFARRTRVLRPPRSVAATRRSRTARSRSPTSWSPRAATCRISTCRSIRTAWSTTPCCGRRWPARR